MRGANLVCEKALAGRGKMVFLEVAVFAVGYGVIF
jgi:hypothetical protein